MIRLVYLLIRGAAVLLLLLGAKWLLGWHFIRVAGLFAVVLAAHIMWGFQWNHR